MRRRLSNWLPLLLLAAARADDDDEACSGTYTLSGQDIRLKTAPLGAASPYALASQPDGECARRATPLCASAPQTSSTARCRTPSKRRRQAD